MHTFSRLGSSEPFIGSIARSAMAREVASSLASRGLDESEAEKLFGLDDGHLHDALAEPEGVPLDTWLSWLMALGHPIQINVGTSDEAEGQLIISTAAKQLL